MQSEFVWHLSANHWNTPRCIIIVALQWLWNNLVSGYNLSSCLLLNLCCPCSIPWIHKQLFFSLPRRSYNGLQWNSMQKFCVSVIDWMASVQRKSVYFLGKVAVQRLLCQCHAAVSCMQWAVGSPRLRLGGWNSTTEHGSRTWTLAMWPIFCLWQSWIWQTANLTYLYI